MLGYFGIYSQNGSSWFAKSADQSRKRNFFLGILPHEIAMLNATSAARSSAERAKPSDAEERRAA